MIYVCVEPNRTEPNKYSILFIIASLTLLLLIAGCGPAPSQELAAEGDGEVPSPPPPPPAPSSPGLAGQAYANVDGEQVCYTDEQLQNLFASDPELMILNGGVQEIGVAQWGNDLAAIEGTHLNFTTRSNYWVYGTAYMLKNCAEWVPLNLQPGPPRYGRGEDIIDANGVRQGQWITYYPHFFRDTSWITVNRNAPPRGTLAGLRTRQAVTEEEEVVDNSHWPGKALEEEQQQRGEMFFIDGSWERGVPQYFVTYGCNRDADGFNCHDGKWVLGEFTIKEGTPLLANFHILEGVNDPIMLGGGNALGEFSVMMGTDAFKYYSGSPDRDRRMVSLKYPAGVDVSNIEVWMTNSKMVVRNSADYLRYIILSTDEQRGVIVCPDATTVDEVVPGCRNEIRYAHEQCTGAVPSACVFFGGKYQITFNQPDKLEELDGTVGVGIGPNLCENGVLDADETDIDCGGACGATCTDGDACIADADCASNICEENACLELPDVAAPAGVPELPE